MKKIILFFMILVMTLFMSCRSKKELKDNRIYQTHEQFEKTRSKILNTYWKLLSIDDQPIKMDDHQSKESYFLLRNDSTFSGFAKCNTFEGEYILRIGNHILFKNILTTLTTCRYDQEEYKITRLFDEVNSFEIKNDTLYFLKDKSKRLSAFKSIHFE